MAAPDLGTGTTITFGTSGYTAALRDISLKGVKRAVIERTHYGSTEVGKIPGDIIDNGSYDAEWEFDPALLAIPGNRLHETARETITINFGGSGNTAAFTGFVSDMSVDMPNEDIMVMKGTIQVDGAVTWA